MDAISLLERDHREVERLMDELEATTERGVKTREQLFDRLSKAMTVHEVIEEEIFYPNLQGHPKAKDIVLESYEEHDVVNKVMADLLSIPFGDESWGPTAKVMMENLRHHIGEEEEHMFPAARKVFDEAELDQLGGAMAARKAQATTEIEEGVPG